MKSITFTGESIRAILRIDSPKTQTRRVTNPQPPTTFLNPTLVARDSNSPSGFSFISDEYGSIELKCPYGRPGDLLWVKENYAYPIEYDHLKPSQVSGQGIPVFYEANTEKDWKIQSNGKVVGKWRSSRFMPRLASRITLEVVSILVEPLQEITVAGMLAEGIHDNTLPFKQTWDSINAKKQGFAWRDNPYVFVISFSIMEGDLSGEI